MRTNRHSGKIPSFEASGASKYREIHNLTQVKKALSFVLAFQELLEATEAVPARRAAIILGVDRKTVYRWLGNGTLELVPRRGKAWVSLRSIWSYMEANYSPTTEFNLWDELLIRVATAAPVTGH